MWRESVKHGSERREGESPSTYSTYKNNEHYETNDPFIYADGSHDG